MTTQDPDLLARVEQLERQQAMQTEAIRRLVEGRWTGDLPHAAAAVVALMGGHAPQDFTPVDFPKG